VGESNHPPPLSCVQPETRTPSENTAVSSTTDSTAAKKLSRQICTSTTIKMMHTRRAHTHTQARTRGTHPQHVDMYILYVCMCMSSPAPTVPAIALTQPDGACREDVLRSFSFGLRWWILQRCRLLPLDIHPTMHPTVRPTVRPPNCPSNLHIHLVRTARGSPPGLSFVRPANGEEPARRRRRRRRRRREGEEEEEEEEAEAAAEEARGWRAYARCCLDYIYLDTVALGASGVAAYIDTHIHTQQAGEAS